MAVFFSTFAAMIPLTLVWGSRSEPISWVLPACAVLLSGLVAAYMLVSVLRSYFRDLDTMKRQLLAISFDKTRCSCCEQDHVDLSGRSFLCDRLLVKKCVTVWFGSQAAFEETVRSEVLEVVSRDLNEGVLNTKSPARPFRIFAYTKSPQKKNK